MITVSAIVAAAFGAGAGIAHLFHRKRAKKTEAALRRLQSAANTIGPIVEETVRRHK